MITLNLTDDEAALLLTGFALGSTMVICPSRMRGPMATLTKLVAKPDAQTTIEALSAKLLVAADESKLDEVIERLRNDD